MDYITENQLKKDLRRFKPFWHGKCKIVDPVTHNAEKCCMYKARARGYVGVHPVVSLNHKRGGVQNEC